RVGSPALLTIVGGKIRAAGAREADAAIDARGAMRWGRNANGRESGHAIRRPNGECFFKHTRHSFVLKV
ncbi:hypothetical protein, partial [Escherichia coli]|uniref:hypothetical protein n=1 Tax=Escherichia coli TaxID=562 RepID=UPI0019D5965B